MSLYVYPYNQGSASAASIATALGAVRIIPDAARSRFKGSLDKTVINWGSTRVIPSVLDAGRILNKPESVALAANKKTFFQCLRSSVWADYIPLCWYTKIAAQDAMQRGYKMCARTVLNGHSGNGLVIVEPDDWANLPDAELYTAYVKKRDEFRVHVVGDKVISLQRKGLRAEFRDNPDINWEIRNLANGFVFTRSDVNIPDAAKRLCIGVIKTLGLDFGAVDLVYNAYRDAYRVLEVNTAPGLAGTTIEEYKAGLLEYLQQPAVNPNLQVNEVNEMMARREEELAGDRIDWALVAMNDLQVIRNRNQN